MKKRFDDNRLRPSVQSKLRRSLERASRGGGGGGSRLPQGARNNSRDRRSVSISFERYTEHPVEYRSPSAAVRNTDIRRRQDLGVPDEGTKLRRESVRTMVTRERGLR